MKFAAWFFSQTQLFPQAVCADVYAVRRVGSMRLTRYKFAENQDREALANLIERQATEAAHTLATVQVVIALVDQYDARIVEHALQLPESVSPSATYDLESPTLEGVCKQLMRHTEALMKSHTLGAQQTHNALSLENERLRARLDALEGRHFETVALQEELLSQRHTRDIEAMRAVAGEERKAAMFRSVNTVLPAMLPEVANKLLGRGNAAEAPAQAPTDPAINAFAESLTQEQLGALSSVLRPEQVVALGLLFQRHKPKSPPPPPSDPGDNNLN